MGPLWALNIALSAVSLALLAGLVYVYARNLRQLRSAFTFGLVAFAGLFLLQNLMALFVYMSLDQQGIGANVATPMLGLNAAELVALASLFYITWR